MKQPIYRPGLNEWCRMTSTDAQKRDQGDIMNSCKQISLVALLAFVTMPAGAEVTYNPSGKGCTGKYSEMVRFQRTLASGEERVYLHTAVWTRLQQAGGCSLPPTNSGIVVLDDETNKSGPLVSKLLVAKAMDSRIFLRVGNHGDSDCRLSYVLLYGLN